MDEAEMLCHEFRLFLDLSEPSYVEFVRRVRALLQADRERILKLVDEFAPWIPTIKAGYMLNEMRAKIREGKS